MIHNLHSKTSLNVPGSALQSTKRVPGVKLRHCTQKHVQFCIHPPFIIIIIIILSFMSANYFISTQCRRPASVWALKGNKLQL